MKIVMNLDMQISSENIPAHMLKTIEKMKTINGNYITQDNMNKISSVDINFDGETVNLTFKIHKDVHKVSCKEEMTIPVNAGLMFLTTLDQDAVMKVKIDINGEATTVQLSSNDSLWEWTLCLEVRYGLTRVVINFTFNQNICFHLKYAILLGFFKKQSFPKTPISKAELETVLIVLSVF